MPLIYVVFVLVLIGVGLWALNTKVAMDPKIKNIINWVVVVAVIIWLLQLFGLLDALYAVKVGRHS